MYEECPRINNCLIEGERIEKLNLSEEEIARLDGNVEKIDLYGKTMLPGFHDSHLHGVAYAYQNCFCVNLEDAASIRDVICRMREFIKERKIPSGGWIVGMGWNHENFEEKRLITKEDLDKVSSEHYIFAKRCDIHTASVNTKTAELCGLKALADKGDKNIGRYESGTINGIIYENAVRQVVQYIPPLSLEEIESLILFTANEARKAGLTSLQSDDMQMFSDFVSREHILHAYDKLRREKRLPLRVVEQIQITSIDEYQDFLKIFQTMKTDDFFSFGIIKLLLDGTLGSETAALTKPYRSDCSNFGVLNFSNEELTRIIKFCINHNLQIMCHTIGDAAVNQFLSVIDECRGNEKISPSPRLVHCQIMRDNQITKMAELGIHADVQPMFVLSDAKIINQKLQKETNHKWFAWKTMIKNGIHLNGSSDSPVDTFHPMAEIAAAVTRHVEDDKGSESWEPEERLSITEALQMYTIKPAESILRGDKLGQIREGYLADFVVLNQNPYLISPEEIKNIKILDTFCAGTRNQQIKGEKENEIRF